MAFEGLLADIPVVDVLQLLHVTRRSGVLLVFGKCAQASIFLKGGMIIGVTHPDAGMNAGRVAMDLGLVEQADLDRAVARQKAAGAERKPLIATLVELGLDREDGYKALERLVEATVAELVSWRDGCFVFEAGNVPVLDDFGHVPEAVPTFDTQTTLMEALRIIDERARDGGTEPVAEAGAPVRRSGPRVLIVDDDPAVLRAMQRLVETAGYQATVAGGGAEALRLAGEQSFDAALVDYLMPHPDGLEVLRHLRLVQPLCARLLVSGALDVDVVIDAVNRGQVSAILPKPAEYHQVVPALERAVGGSGGALRACLEDDLLQIAVQPIVYAESLDIFAFEALLRATHTELRSPAHVFAAAEKHGRIDDVADVVARKSGEWLRCLPERFKLFINMHPRELANPRGLANRIPVFAGLHQRVVLEVTERERAPSPEILAESLGLLRNAGFALAIDDLGAGYSSLSFLAGFGVEFVKIDRSVVHGVGHDPKRLRLVQTLTEVSKRAGASVIAEGVETETESEVLRRAGADFFQGYLYGRPSLAPRIVLHGGRFRFVDDSRAT